MVERRPGIIPPQQRPPERGRPSRALVLRRRLVALGVVAAAIALAWFAIAGVSGKGKQPAPKAVGPPPPFRVVFPEGFTRRQMAARIEAVAKIAKHERDVVPALSRSAYLADTARSPLPGRFAGDRKPRLLEGFLFPATYDFTRRTTSAQLVAQQLKAFRKNWAHVDLRYARSKNLTPYDVLIIASMIEKEAKAPEERALVSAVIYNRLHARMRLEIDATIRYALHVPGTESLLESQLRNPTPYNTRRHFGLPPTPIANPGLASMQAAAHPRHVKYLFYVARPDKLHHFFTASYQAFDHYKKTHGYK